MNKTETATKSKCIEIAFAPDMEAAILADRKTKTFRSSKKGEPGDHFVVKGQLFLLEAVEPTEAIMAAREHYAEEGFTSPYAFIHRWIELHPYEDWVPNMTGWMHTFHRVVPDLDAPKGSRTMVEKMADLMESYRQQMEAQRQMPQAGRDRV